MIVRAVDKRGDTVKTDVLVVGVFSPASMPDELKAIDKKINGAITYSLKNFEGEFQQTRLIPTLGKIPAKNILLFGLGKKKEANLETLRKAAGVVARIVRDGVQVKTYATLLHMANISAFKDDRAQAVAEGTILGGYQYTKYKTVDKDKIKELSEVMLLGAKEKGVKKGIILAESANLARDLVNEPGSDMTPEKLAKVAKSLTKFGVKVTVYDKKAIEKLGLTALLAVNRGSVNEPRFVVMEYNGGGKKIALVGKGITFDSGGLNIKPGDSMLTMKEDMHGAATVIATMRAAAQLKVKKHLFGVIASTDNMPGKNAYKPGDYIPTFSGKTIEIANTDAEGRVILSDALAYTEKKLKPSAIIDLATLTGACVVALGNVCAGVMGREQKIIDLLTKSGLATGERVWQLPFYKEYHDQVKSEHADVRNLGTIRGSAGAITAGALLAAFVEKTPWAHIDIAGVSWADAEAGYTKKGGTGFGVRLLIHALENWNA